MSEMRGESVLSWPSPDYDDVNLAHKERKCSRGEKTTSERAQKHHTEAAGQGGHSSQMKPGIHLFIFSRKIRSTWHLDSIALYWFWYL